MVGYYFGMMIQIKTIYQEDLQYLHGPVLDHAGRAVHHVGEGGAHKPPSETWQANVKEGEEAFSCCNLGMEWRALVRDGERPNCIF